MTLAPPGNRRSHERGDRFRPGTIEGEPVDHFEGSIFAGAADHSAGAGPAPAVLRAQSEWTTMDQAVGLLGAVPSFRDHEGLRRIIA
jgi:hypothetical protein